MISESRQEVWSFRLESFPYCHLLLPPWNLLTLVTAETLPAHITDTASVPSQPLLAQPVVTVTYWKWDNERVTFLLLVA